MNDVDHEVSIYFHSRLPVARGGIEDDLEEALAGYAEVVGGGSGVAGSHIDLEFEETDPQAHLATIRRVLLEVGVGRDTVIQIGPHSHPLTEEP
ncbi:MAG: hypothetical protein ACPGUV_09810 [Polyangiales bacterium]